jgi:predicted nucleotidyltransferase
MLACVDIARRIDRALSETERANNVTVLYACEAGSRAWGFASADSDYDVRFIYMHARERYIALDEPAQQLDVTQELDGERFDIVGWDVLKTLRLLRRSNPALIEWLHSPIVYRAPDPFAAGLRELARELFVPVTCAFHYANMARTNSRDVVAGMDMNLKRFFYTLRASLAFDWIYDGRGMPPVPFGELVRAMIGDGSPAMTEINDLLERKRSSVERASGPRLPHVQRLLEQRMEGFSSRLDELSLRDAKPPLKPSDTEMLNTFLRDVIMLRSTKVV